MKVDLITTIGILTVVSSYAIKLIGFPDQFRKLLKSKSTENLSIPLFVFSFISYILWTVYGIIKNDWVVILGQSIGVIAVGIILLEIIKIQKKK